MVPRVYRPAPGVARPPARGHSILAAGGPASAPSAPSAPSFGIRYIDRWRGCQKVQRAWSIAAVAPPRGDAPSPWSLHHGATRAVALARSDERVEVWPRRERPVGAPTREQLVDHGNALSEGHHTGEIEGRARGRRDPVTVRLVTLQGHDAGDILAPVTPHEPARSPTGCSRHEHIDARWPGSEHLDSSDRRRGMHAQSDGPASPPQHLENKHPMLLDGQKRAQGRARGKHSRRYPDPLA